MSEKKKKQARKEAMKTHVYAVKVIIMAPSGYQGIESIWETKSLAEKHIRDDMKFIRGHNGNLDMWELYQCTDNVIVEHCFEPYLVASVVEVDKDNLLGLDYF